MKCVLLIEKEGQCSAVPVSFDDNNPVVIGRAWKNDVIINDPYVDSEHLSLSANEDHFFIEDLNSQNGTLVEKKQVDNTASYSMGDSIVVGETTLRLIDANAEVAPALKIEKSNRLIKRIDSFWFIPIAVIFVLLATYLQGLWGGDVEQTADLIVNSMMYAVGAMLIWTLAVGILSKLFRQKAAFTLAAIVFSVVMVLELLFNLIGNAIKFNLNSGLAITVIDQIVVLTPLVFMLYATLSLVTRFSRFVKVCVTSALCVFVLLASVYFPTLQPEHQRWSRSVSGHHLGQPAALFFGTTESLDAHMTKTSNLFDQLEQSP